MTQIGAEVDALMVALVAAASTVGAVVLFTVIFVKTSQVIDDLRDHRLDDLARRVAAMEARLDGVVGSVGSVSEARVSAQPVRRPPRHRRRLRAR